MLRTYCYLCAATLEKVSNSSWWCPSCKYTQYENPRPCVELIVFHKNKILICERGREPSKGSYDMPGGFIEVNETIEQALNREVEEELSLVPSNYSEPQYFASYYMQYPFGKEVYNNLISVFMVNLLADPSAVKPNDDVASVKWIELSDVSEVNWASFIHLQNAEHALKRVRVRR